MDILSPELLWIDKCCYRLPFLKGQDAGYNNDRSNHNYEEYSDETKLVCTEDPCDKEYDVEVMDSGRFRLKLPIPKAFWPKLVGMKGSAKRRVEEETRTKVDIPRQTQDGDIVITGENRRDVLLARSHIEASVRASRQRMQYTHFLSIPVQNQQVRKNYEEFKAQAKKLCPSLKDSIFTPVEKLHMTLVLLVLTDNQERMQALEMFNQLSLVVKKKLAGRQLEVEIKGIDIMNDDAAKTSVLYARAVNPVLQEVAEEAAAWFSNSDYVKERDMQTNLKIHVTLMNSKFLQTEEVNDEAPKRRGQQSRQPRLDFDARAVLQELRSFSFGTITVNSIHLSQMGNTSSDGYYTSSAVMQF